MIVAIAIIFIAVCMLGFPQVRAWLGKLAVAGLIVLLALSVLIVAAAELGEDGALIAFIVLGLLLMAGSMWARAGAPHRAR